VMTKAEITDAAWIRGTAGNDTVNYATSADEKIYGGTGNDDLWGGGGSDTYIYALGDGSDIINESGWTTNTDVLKFLDLDREDIELTRVGSGLRIQVLATGHSISIGGEFNVPGPAEGIEEIRFADNTMMTKAQIIEAAWTRGTAGNDTLNGNQTAERLHGGAGNDTIRASGGNDIVFGGAGNDNLYGDSGADTFLFMEDVGNDVIRDFSLTDGDVITFEDEIFDDYADVMAAATQSGSDVTITIDASNSVLVKNVLMADLTSTYIHFS
jgi:Ca2+-binding RTX toxin-like protein